MNNNGYYQKLLETAEGHGLHIVQRANYGWTITTLSEETATWPAAGLLRPPCLFADRLKAAVIIMESGQYELCADPTVSNKVLQA